SPAPAGRCGAPAFRQTGRTGRPDRSAQRAPYTGTGSGESASSRGTTEPSSAGSHLAPLSSDAARCQPSHTVTLPPSTSKTRPVTSPEASEPSHTTSGETLAGSMASKEPSSGGAIWEAMPSPAEVVIRVRAAGAIALAVMP